MHFAGTFDGDADKGIMYINGENVKETTITADMEPVLPKTIPLYLGGMGNNGNHEVFNGRMCEIAIYARALSKQEVYDHFRMGRL